MSEVEVQNKTDADLFLHDLGRIVERGEIAKVEKEVADKLKATGVWTLGEDIDRELHKVFEDRRAAIEGARNPKRTVIEAPSAVMQEKADETDKPVVPGEQPSGIEHPIADVTPVRPDDEAKVADTVEPVKPADTTANTVANTPDQANGQK